MSTLTQKPLADSREHPHAFNLHDASDVPQDFPIPFLPEPWEWAMFVPGDKLTRWRRPKFPPRVYLLTRESLAVLAHPKSGFPSFTSRISDLVEIACYRALLHGDVEFRTAEADSGRLFYRTVQHKFIDPYLRRLSSLWLTPTQAPSVPAFEHHLQRTGSRCLVALQIELHQSAESVTLLCYQKSFSRRSRRSFFLGHEEVAARLLAWTNLRLILVIEGWDELEDPRGVRICWAPATSVSSVRRESHGSLRGFTLIFKGRETCWQFWLSDEAEISAMEAILSSLGYPQG